MAYDPIDKFYRVEVREGPNKPRPAFFLRTLGGRCDLLYGSMNYLSGSFGSIEEAVEDFRKHLQAEHEEHGASGAQVLVSVSTPVETTLEDVQRRNPGLSVLVPQAARMLKEMMAKSIDPTQIILGWEWIDDPASQSCGRLWVKLSDETGAVSVEFTPQELKDGSLMRSRLVRLYGDLLDIRVGKRLEPVLESILEHQGR